MGGTQPSRARSRYGGLLGDGHAHCYDFSGRLEAVASDADNHMYCLSLS